MSLLAKEGMKRERETSPTDPNQPFLLKTLLSRFPRRRHHHRRVRLVSSAISSAAEHTSFFPPPSQETNFPANFSPLPSPLGTTSFPGRRKRRFANINTQRRRERRCKNAKPVSLFSFFPSPLSPTLIPSRRYHTLATTGRKADRDSPICIVFLGEMNSY